MTDRERLRRIATLAHESGLVQLDAYSVLQRVRQLTIEYWDHSGTETERRARVRDVVNQLDGVVEP